MMSTKTCFGLLALGVLSLASSVTAQPSYTYTPPAPAAVTAALQTQPRDMTSAADLTTGTAAVTPIDNRPGLIRPASELATAQHHDDDHRGFACADKKCKTVTPVYNTETPIQREQVQLGRN